MDRGIIAFVAPPWGEALDGMEGVDLQRTMPPIGEVIDDLLRLYPRHKLLFATQVYEKLRPTSLTEVQARFDWNELHVYNFSETGSNHGILLGTRGWAARG